MSRGEFEKEAPDLMSIIVQLQLVLEKDDGLDSWRIQCLTKAITLLEGRQKHLERMSP